MDQPTKPMRVLLVDDDEDDYLIVRNLLAKRPDSGFTLEWLQESEEARASIEKAEHDVYLIDYRLGAANGLELLEDINIQERPEPFIILTGAGDRRIERKAMNIGVADYLVKGSFDAELLLRVLSYSLQRKLLEEQRLQHLKEVNRSKDEFISLASHQLRTPATVVKQYVGMIMDGYAGEITDDQRTMLNKAYEGNELQLKIVNDLLHVATLDAGRVRLKKAAIDPVRLVREVIQDQQARISARNQGAKVMVSGEPIELHADELKLRMVLDNLIDNASKYSDSGSNIVIRISFDNHAVRIAVQDQGVGIRADEQDKLFQKFSRLPNRLSTEVGGSGLGLYWAKHILDLHGGTIVVKSSEAQGSTFTLVLPA